MQLIIIFIWWRALSWAQNLLMATRELRQFVDDEPVCRDMIRLTAEEGKTLVDMVTGCHDDTLDAISLYTPSPSSSPYHHHQQQQQQQQQLPDINTACGNTSAQNFCPELFLNTCDEKMTSSSSSSSSLSSSAAEATAPLHFRLTSSCASVAS